MVVVTMARKSKPISFISWNTEPFLKSKLDELINKDTILFYMFIKHVPEDDETKPHIHLFVIPNGTLDTDAFRGLFDEFDPNNPHKPIRLSPYKPSKFLDAYLYFLHDINYLANIGQTRKYHYLDADIVTSDYDYMHELYLTSDRSKLNGSKVQMVAEAIADGMTWSQYVSHGHVPVQQLPQYRMLWETLSSPNITYRNNRTGHEGKGHSNGE